MTTIDAGAMGRAIALGEYLCRREFAYDFVFAPRAADADELAQRVGTVAGRLAGIGARAVSVGGLAGIRIPHTVTDGIGAWTALTRAAAGAPVVVTNGPVDVAADPPAIAARPTRLGRQPHIARPFADAPPDAPTAMCLYRLTAIDSSRLTVRIVAAVHAAVDAEPRLRHRPSAVAVSVTAAPWADGREVANLSSACLSVLSPADRPDAATAATQVERELARARAHRAWLVGSNARFGRIRRPAWPLLQALGAGGGARETAVVSNLGRLPAISGLTDGVTTFLTVPVRSHGSVSVGVLGVDGTLTATVTAQSTPDEVDRFAGEVWKQAGFEVERVG